MRPTLDNFRFAQCRLNSLQPHAGTLDNLGLHPGAATTITGCPVAGNSDHSKSLPHNPGVLQVVIIKSGASCMAREMAAEPSATTKVWNPQPAKPGGCEIADNDPQQLECDLAHFPICIIARNPLQ
jgi:hypothetical protein